MNLVKDVVTGSEMYNEGIRMLEMAIAEYDQSVLDLTAEIVAGNTLHKLVILIPFKD